MYKANILTLNVEKSTEIQILLTLVFMTNTIHNHFRVDKTYKIIFNV